MGYNNKVVLSLHDHYGMLDLNMLHVKNKITMGYINKVVLHFMISMGC